MYISVNSWFQTGRVALHSEMCCVRTIRAVSGDVTFCIGAKSNQKGRRSNAAGAWLLLLDKFVHARCGWASCPSSRASIALGVLPRSVCRCFYNPFLFVFIRVNSWFQTFRFTYSFSAFSASPRESFFYSCLFVVSTVPSPIFLRVSVPLWPFICRFQMPFISP